MAFTIADLKSDLEGVLHGTTLNKVRNLTELIYRASRQVLLDCDPPETERIQNIENALYDDVTRYAIPSDLKGNKVIDVRPQVSRSLNDNFSQRYGEEFDLYKSDNTVAIEHDDGTKFVRIKKVLNQGVLINGCDSLTANGTWAASGTASNLTVDSVYYESGAASLNFDLTASASDAILENSTMTQVDLTNHDEKSSLFIWLYIPTTARITNVILRWGNDSSNYWSATATAAFDGTAFRTGWNLLRYDWNGATETGTVDPARVDYIRLTITRADATADTDLRLDSIYSRLPSIYEMVYYSNSLFRSTSGTFKEKPTLDTDIINMSADGYNLLVDQASILTGQQVQGKDGSFDLTFFQNRYTNNLKTYKSLYPSRYIKPQEFYYRI